MEIAEDENENGWERASQLAAKMLPQIFRPDSPVFELNFPPEYQLKLEKLLESLPPELFTASDSLGWVYQFWQSKKKDEVNESGVKIGARELPAVTQLFTEPYMVSFLLDNSLGAWWAVRQLSPEILKTAKTEEELRKKAAIKGVPLEYLRFIKDENGWMPAAGTYEAWPNDLSDFSVLDPCCGSGHFLVATLLMLVPMRMELENLSPQDAVDAVLQENLHGLELDQRCVELAAFAVALAAWTYPNAGGYRPLPELNIACSGLSVGVAKEEWKELKLGSKNLSLALDWMYKNLKLAPQLGSLFNPATTDSAHLVEWEDLAQGLEKALSLEKNLEKKEMEVAAQGLVKSSTLLGKKYNLVVTNVPYLARGKQNKFIQDYCKKHYPKSKKDLATVFLERILELLLPGGTISTVITQNWLFLIRYKKLRKELVEKHKWNIVSKLGSSAFVTITGEVVKAILLILTKENGTVSEGDLFEDEEGGNQIRGIDVSAQSKPKTKAEQLILDQIKSVSQAQQLKNPDARISLEHLEGFELLNEYSKSLQGIVTSDYSRFGRMFYEINKIDKRIWELQQSTVKDTCFHGGNNYIIFWESGKGILAKYEKARVQGLEGWTKLGVSVSQMSKLNVSLHSKSSFDNNTAVIIPDDEKYLPAIWCFCSSPEYNQEVRQIDQALKVTNATLGKVPFDLEYWTEVAKKEYPQGLPQPFSNDPTQWIFHGQPCGSVIWDETTKTTTKGKLRMDSNVLQVAVARLLGYRWPAELDQNMELAPQQRQWVENCEPLLNYIDRDGLVCIPAVRGESPGSDRLLNLLAAAYGDEWSNEVLSKLLSSAGHNGKTLESWLRSKFFAQHLKLFGQRPFIWQIWDGLNDGFSVLVNYHKFDKKLLETLIYTYLGDWINRQKKAVSEDIDGSQGKLAAAQALKKKLEKILEGESPYDIFVRWKPLSEQPLGWEPDLNDGVRLNIRPFMKIDDVRYTGAGVLRKKPNIKWHKDRGKDVESAPWYDLGPQYGGKKGDRINDHHLTLAEKQKARE
jgi:hypothetical protein